MQLTNRQPSPLLSRPIKKLPGTVDIDEKAPKSELAQKISSATGLSIHRIRLTKANDGSVIESLNGLGDQEVVHVKDLGPQISWRTVFIIEYFGLLVIHPLSLIPSPRAYLYPHLPVSISTLPPTTHQKFLCFLIILHFLKRELETLYVHKFSSSTMPVRNIFKNSFHYWIISGLNLAWFLYHPLTITDGKYRYWEPSNNAMLFLIATWVWAELSNFSTHLALSNLRPEGTTTRGIPRGYGFNWVTCPNYFFEAVGWLCLWVLSGFNWSLILFTVASSAQVYLWAIKKEKRYRKEFGDKYKKKRAVMIPGLL